MFSVQVIHYLCIRTQKQILKHLAKKKFFSFPPDPEREPRHHVLPLRQGRRLQALPWVLRPCGHGQGAERPAVRHGDVLQEVRGDSGTYDTTI